MALSIEQLTLNVTTAERALKLAEDGMIKAVTKWQEAEVAWGIYYSRSITSVQRITPQASGQTATPDLNSLANDLYGTILNFKKASVWLKVAQDAKAAAQ